MGPPGPAGTAGLKRHVKNTIEFASQTISSVPYISRYAVEVPRRSHETRRCQLERGWSRRCAGAGAGWASSHTRPVHGGAQPLPPLLRHLLQVVRQLQGLQLQPEPLTGGLVVAESADVWLPLKEAIPPGPTAGEAFQF